MNRSWRLLLSLFAAFALVASACGSDSASDGETEAGSEATDEASEATDEASEATEEASEAMASDEMDDMEEDEMGEHAESFNVGLTFDIGGRGDQSFNDSALAGVQKAEADLGITFTDVEPNNDGSNRAELLQLQADNSPLVLAIGFLFEADVTEVAAQNPDVNFAVIDSAMADVADNVAGLTFAEEQGSFLVGAAAAMQSETGNLGFIGGVSGFGLIEKFEAGFTAGAQSVNPDVVVQAQYITEFPDFDGFSSPDRAKEIASAMYEAGADVIYHAAGGAGNGLFEAAKATTEASGSKVWAIGVDSDQALLVSEDLQEFILTSMLKRVDVAVFEITAAHADGSFAGGTTVYDLSVDGVGYSTTGGHLDAFVDDLEALKAQIIAGDIVVPTEPAS